jgi:hypothetical protein
MTRCAAQGLSIYDLLRRSIAKETASIGADGDKSVRPPEAARGVTGGGAPGAQTDSACPRQESNLEPSD